MATRFLILLKVVFCLISTVYSQNSCLKTYQGLFINGSDMNGVQGRASDCCQFCQQKRNCLAYSWNNFNGGTCWLKSDTQPLYQSNGTGDITGILGPSTNRTYSLTKKYAAPNFFEDFWFDNRTGHVFGFSQFVGDNETAWSNGLVGYRNDNKVYIGVDHTTNISDNVWGRLTVRINSFQRFNAGLFILSMDHLPVGPYEPGSGWHSSPVWPAFWFAGDDDTNGEIDPYEGFNPGDTAYSGIHNWDPAKYGNCTLPDDIEKYFNGSGRINGGWTELSPHGTADEPFNRAGGGAYVLQWDREKFVRVWTFVKPNIPTDILNENPNPNPDTWGMPNAYFPLGANCNPDIFNNVYAIFNIAFCNPPISQFCMDVVRHSPGNFTDTYFLINYLKVFCRPNENCWVSNVTISE